METLTALTTRRSAAKLVDPAPDDTVLESLLGAGMNAPDHGRLKPWRFLVLRGAARERFGDVLAEGLKRREPDTPPDRIEAERKKPLRAPLILVVAAAVVTPHKIPVIEQVMAAAAATQNIIIAAHAQGFGAMWRTGAPAYDPYVKERLGLSQDDVIVGFLYLGTSAGDLPAMPAAPSTDFVRPWP